MTDPSNNLFPPIDPNDTDYRVVVWCSADGTNDASATDTGELQSGTISSGTVFVESMTNGTITIDSWNSNAITIKGTAYAAATAQTAWFSGGTNGADATVVFRVTIDDGRTLDKTMTLPIRSK